MIEFYTGRLAKRCPVNRWEIPQLSRRLIYPSYEDIRQELVIQLLLMWRKWLGKGKKATGSGFHQFYLWCRLKLLDHLRDLMIPPLREESLREHPSQTPSPPPAGHPPALPLSWVIGLGYKGKLSPAERLTIHYVCSGSGKKLRDQLGMSQAEVRQTLLTSRLLLEDEEKENSYNASDNTE